MTNKLPAHFQFSQSSLQDYADCARRFQLRYMERLAWPAPEAEPLLAFEQHQALGERFHELVHRHLIGIPAERLSPLAADEPLRHWWENYLRTGLRGLPQQRHPEITLTAPLGAYRVIAKYDLIAVEPGQQAVIMDWKTSLQRPRRERLATRLQTVVYRYLLARAGAHLNGDQPITPEQVEMVYWFAEHPDEPERFPYSTAQFHEDEAYLRRLVGEIETREVFELTSDLTRCTFCTYRSLCKRGEKAGDYRLAEVEDTEDIGAGFTFDLEQVTEIDF